MTTSCYLRWLCAEKDSSTIDSARGPDNFDYGLGMNISDDLVRLYNGKKNPSAEVTVVGWDETRKNYQPNR